MSSKSPKSKSPKSKSPKSKSPKSKSPKSKSPVYSHKSKRSNQKTEYIQFIYDLNTISTNMLEDKDFENNAENYKKWLLAPESLQKINHKSYTKVCENIVDEILNVMYQFHTKIRTDRVKTQKQANIIYGIIVGLTGAYFMYNGVLVPKILADSYGISAGIIGGISSGLTGLLSAELFYRNKKLSKKDTEEALKVEELFLAYIECVLSI
jgi:hypothetical protein